MKLLIRIIAVVSFCMFAYVGCKEENEFTPFPPSILFQGANSVTSEREKAVTIPVIVKSPIGIKSLSLNGETAGDVVVGIKADTIEVEYMVPASASVGERIELNFELTDIENVSSILKYEVNVIDFIPPVVTFIPVSAAANLERGQTTKISLILNAPNKVQSLTLNNQAISGVVPGEVLDTVTYDFVTPADAPFGLLPVEFVLTDQRGKSATRAFNVTVIGSTINLSTLASSGVISTVVTLEKQNVYKLDASLSVASGGVLNIPAGTKIYAVTGMSTPFTLTIENTGQINAVGTVSEPVVFSSDKLLLPTPSPVPGDWHGIRMNGGAGINMGTLRYVRIEYGGGGRFPNQQPGLRLDGVTAPTTLEYIQIYKANHVGIFYRAASTVPLKNAIVTECAEASIFVRDTGTDPDFQFIILEAGAKDSLIVPSPVPAEGRMLEVRQVAGGATISNMTIIGPGTNVTGTIDAIRTDRRIQVLNTLVAEFPDDGIRYDVPAADITIPPILTGAVFAHSYIFKVFDMPTRDNGSPALALPFETNAGAFTNVIDKANVPAAAAGISNTSFVPTALIPSTFDPTTLGANFSAGQFVGAIGSVDWTKGWALNPNGTVRQ